MKFSKKIFLLFIFSSCGYKAPPPGKPDFENPKIKVINLKDKDTIRDTIKISLEVEDNSKIKWVKMIVDGKEFIIDTIPPFEFKLSPPQKKINILFQAMDKWENIGSSKTFEIFGPFIDTVKVDTLKKKKK
ncbi:MAG: Ig-like domain-containing protein [candidate division WOR-3 bacterium]